MADLIKNRNLGTKVALRIRERLINRERILISGEPERANAEHATLLSLERLENLGFFRSEYLNACKIELEHTRANANDELIETFRDYEHDEGGRFYRMQKEWQVQLKDPDDVFFAAKSRKEEIKEQMKSLQHAGLDRMKPQKKKASSARKKQYPRSDRHAAADFPQRPFPQLRSDLIWPLASFKVCCSCTRHADSDMLRCKL